MIKRLPSCNRTEALRLSLYHLITACCHMRLPVTVEIRRYLRSLPLQKACLWNSPQPAGSRLPSARSSEVIFAKTVLAPGSHRPRLSLPFQVFLLSSSPPFLYLAALHLPNVPSIPCFRGICQPSAAFFQGFS